MSIEISTSQSRLDLDWIAKQVQASYWGGHMKRPAIERTVARSLVFGAYDGPAMVGYLRVVTDSGFFSSVAEIIVQDDRRGQGIGSALMTAAMEHEDVRETMCILRARPAAALWYLKNFDFLFLDKAHGIMQRDPKA